MGISREILEGLENYLYPDMIRTDVWRPFSIEQLMIFLRDFEFSEYHKVKATFGDEIHLFIEDVWAYSIIRYEDLFYIRKVGLSYEEWIAYVQSRSFPLLFAPWRIVIDIWRYWVRKYGLAKAILQQVAVIVAWWLSGVIPVIILKRDLILADPILSILLPFVIGAIMGYIVASIEGLALSVLSLVLSVLIIWRLLIYQKKRKINLKDPFES